MKVVLAALNAKYIHSSLALRYLTGYMQGQDTQVVAKDYSINNGVLDILSDIYSEQPAIVGLACYIWNIDMTLQVACMLKQILPQVKIVLGGPEVSYDSGQLMKKHAFLDYIVLGEGEETLAALLHAVKVQGQVDAILGLTYRKDSEVLEGVPQVVAHMDTLPFPYTDEDMLSLQDKIIYYESSRGCPFSCQYCLSCATNGVRYVSLDKVLDHLKFFIKHKVRQVKFVDRTFNAHKDHYFPILKFLAQQTCTTNFHFEIAADILDEEVLEFLKQAPPGRMQFEIGVQSTYEPTLKQIQRYNNWEKLSENVKKIVSYNNIHVHLDLIVGLPYEDYERFGLSFNDVYSLQPHMLQIGFLKVLRGSGIRKQVREHEYIFMENAPYEVLANKYLAYGELRRLKIFEELFEQIYNSGRFTYILPMLIQVHGENAFAFYQDLTDFWERKGFHLVAHSTKAIYSHLLTFCQENNSESYEICRELMKFNALMSEKGALRPEVLPWNGDEWRDKKSTFWRNETLVQKYIPAYKFTTWRDINKKYHIEIFSAACLQYLVDGHSVVGQKLAVLFCYEDEERYVILDADDFGEEF